MAECRSCSARIIWAEGPSGKAMPVDAEPSPTGNVQLFRRPNGEVYAKVLGPEAAQNVRAAAEVLKAAHTLRTSHFATCANAAQHRKRGGPPVKAGELLPKGSP